MVKMTYVFMSYPAMMGVGARLDFEGIVNLVHKINEIMQNGLLPEELTDVGEVIEDKEILSRSMIKKYLKHYPTIPSKKFEVSDLFQRKNGRPNVAFAYGNVLEVLFENLPLDEVLRRSQHLLNIETHFKTEFFKETTGGNLYKFYLGEKFLSEEKMSLPIVFPFFTVFFIVILVDTAEQVQRIGEIIKSFGSGLREKISGHVWIGQSPATNFISAPFFGISINPIILLPPAVPDYKYDNFLKSLFNSLVAIGEYYNILETIEDAHELCVIASYGIPLELSRSIGSLKINPFKHIFGIYGLRSFNKCERLFHSFLFEDIKHISLYGSKAAQIIQKQEGVFHFPVISYLNTLIESYSGYAPDIIYEHFQSQKKNLDEEFRTAVFKLFEERLNSFKDTLEKMVKDIQGVIEAARTSVQLNLAIITLIWTLFFTMIFTIFPIQEWLNKIFHFLQSLAN